MRRSVVSIPANIAEGLGRSGVQELLHFLSIANRSVPDVETLLMLARRLGYLDDSACTTLLDQAAAVGRLIGGLKRSRKAREHQ